jgi:hypothetical protein
MRAPCRIQEGTGEATTIVVENDVSLNNLNIMVLDVTCEINMTWLEGGPVPFRVLVQNQWHLSTNRAKE